MGINNSIEVIHYMKWLFEMDKDVRTGFLLSCFVVFTFFIMFFWDMKFIFLPWVFLILFFYTNYKQEKENLNNKETQ